MSKQSRIQNLLLHRADTSKQVIDLETGIIYDSCKICAEANNIAYSTLSRKLSGSLKNNTNFKYL